MNKQRGVALSGLMFWGIVFALAAILGMNVAPSYIEYFKIKKNIKATLSQVTPDSTVPEIRRTFERFAQVDTLSFKASELEISKDGGRVVIDFAYEKRIPLFGNVSLLIDYKGSSQD